MIVVGNLNKLVNKILSRIVKGPISKYLKISSNKVVAYNFLVMVMGIIQSILLKNYWRVNRIWILSGLLVMYQPLCPMVLGKLSMVLSNQCMS